MDTSQVTILPRQVTATHIASPWFSSTGTRFSNAFQKQVARSWLKIEYRVCSAKKSHRGDTCHWFLLGTYGDEIIEWNNQKHSHGVWFVGTVVNKMQYLLFCWLHVEFCMAWIKHTVMQTQHASFMLLIWPWSSLSQTKLFAVIFPWCFPAVIDGLQTKLISPRRTPPC